MNFFKLFAFSFITLCLAVLVNAQEPSRAGSRPYDAFSGIALSSTSDTLFDSTTTDTVLSGFTPTKGKEYIFCFKALIGSGSDSTKFAVIMETLDPAGNRLNLIPIDTITDSTGQQVQIPFVYGGVGTSYNILRKGVYGQGDTVVNGGTNYYYPVQENR